jgi:hypothetical protein
MGELIKEELLNNVAPCSPAAMGTKGLKRLE